MNLVKKIRHLLWLGDKDKVFFDFIWGTQAMSFNTLDL